MQAVLLKKPGEPEELYIGETTKPTPQKGELLLKVHASAVNRADTHQRKGNYPPPAGASEIIGLEAAGEIATIGSECKGDWKVGDKVMALLPGGGYAEYATVHEGCVMRIPEHFSYTDAAAIPETWLTAFQILYTIARVDKGDYVLIHAGASGVGTAAIQLCLLAGAKAVVTAGSKEKIDFCLKLGAVAGFNYKEGQFAPKVKEFLSEQKASGINIVLDCVGASYAQQNLDVLALEGRWVFYGTLGGTVVEKLNIGAICWKRVQLLGTTLRTRSLQYKAALVKDFSTRALPYFTKQSGSIHLQPIIDKVFDWTDVVESHKRMESDANTGKIILQITQETSKNQKKETSSL